MVKNQTSDCSDLLRTWLCDGLERRTIQLPTYAKDKLKEEEKSEGQLALYT